MVSASLWMPPLPLLPRSLEVMAIVVVPPNPAVGVNVRPSRAAFRLPSVPRNFIKASLVPSPLLKVRPPVPLNDSKPSAAVSVISNWLPPASTSLMLIRLPLAADSTSGVPGSVDWTPGIPFTGASFTGVTVIATLSESDSGPPLPELPWSLTAMLSPTAAVESAAGVNVSPSKVALMSATVPVTCIMASSVPSPLLNVSPAMPARVSVPLVTESVSWTGAPPASTSPIASRFPPAVENVSGASSLVT